MDERPGRQLALWAVAAVAASALLWGVLRWEQRTAARRWSPLLMGNARAGASTFERKGCVACHASGTSAPAPGAQVSGPGGLVTAMWNHAPQMWRRMQEQGVAAPALGNAEMADLFAWLDTARTAASAGDAARGSSLFASKGCASCHPAPALARSASSVAWAAALWNHPAVPSPAPTLSGEEADDLLAFARAGRPAPSDPDLLAGDADRGERLFRERACVSCHDGAHGRSGADLGRELPPTVARLAGSMWNHAQRSAAKRPDLARPEMADVAAYLYRLRWSEPGGAPKRGEALYAGFGCGRCHGAQGEGTGSGPALRGRGRRFSAIALAATLWRHGPAMYRQTREMGVAWPTLTEAGVGDLIAFLNTPPEEGR